MHTDKISKQKFRLRRGTLTVETNEMKDKYIDEEEPRDSYSVYLRFKTDTCNDGVFISTNEGSFMPEEFAGDVDQFNDLVNYLKKIQKKLNKIYDKQMEYNNDDS